MCLVYRAYSAEEMALFFSIETPEFESSEQSRTQVTAFIQTTISSILRFHLSYLIPPNVICPHIFFQSEMAMILSSLSKYVTNADQQKISDST